MGLIRRFFTFLAKMGLSVRDDPPRTWELSGREWGERAGGLDISIQPLPKEEADQLPGISVVLRNTGAGPRHLTIPGWLHFCQAEVVTPAGSPATLTPFGSELMKAGPGAGTVELNIPANGLTGTDIPIGSVYNMKARGDWRVRVACDIDSARLLSNWTVISV